MKRAISRIFLFLLVMRHRLSNSGPDPFLQPLPVLIRHLDVPHERWIRQGIIRALTIKYGGAEVEEALLRQFYAEPDNQIRWTLANALKVAMPYARRKKRPEIETAYRNSGSSDRGSS